MGKLAMVFTAAQARAAGYSTKQIRHRVDSGAWVTIRRGVYCTRDRWSRAGTDATLMHRLRSAAAILAVEPASWACHSTARRLFGLPHLAEDPAWVELATPPDREVTRGRKHDGINLMPAAVPDHHRCRQLGIPCLTAARTVVDTARSHDLADGLVIADAALHQQLVISGEIDGVLDDCAGWPGITAARRTLRHVGHERESPLESRSFAFFVEEGLPLPECQVDIFTAAGIFVGRVDFLWRAQRVVGEADGKVKYIDAGSPGANDELWRQRLRQDDLDDSGYEVVRWTNGDVSRHRKQTRERILRAFDRARRRFGP
jgi:Transcriptional regulator, AbiEi antitoxin